MKTSTYWLSKYALSDGIVSEVRVQACKPGDEYIYAVGYQGTWFRRGRDIHETKAEAIKAAEAMRIKKIASLRKQIAKLEALKFEE